MPTLNPQAAPLPGQARPDDPDAHGAFVPGPRAHRAPTASGPLDGLRFAVKDLIDVAGVLTTGGNPDWAASHAPAIEDAAVVRALLAAGATLCGKTVTDELAFSLEGANHFHGTPRHPRAPDRLPGGSSSGSAVAVAAGLVDFALGTDTGGSVRVPASFCGVYGFRPTHGRLSLQGVLPFAPSYDTVGWFARSASVLERVGRVLLAPSAARDPVAAGPVHLLMLDDLFALADPEASARLRPLAEALGARAGTTILDGPSTPWLLTYQTLQGAEIWRELGPWLRQAHPRFGPAIAPRFASVAELSPTAVSLSQAWRARHRARLHRLLQTEAPVAEGADPSSEASAVSPACPIWVMPTTPGVALPKSATPEALGSFYARALAMNAIAGHAGLPQVSLPLGELDGLPLGLSLIGPPGSDEALLALAARADPASSLCSDPHP